MMGNVRGPLVGTEALAEGGAAVRDTLTGIEALSEGASALRGALAGLEALTEAGSQIRGALIGFEVVIDVAEEGEMVTPVFPIGLGLSWTTRKTPNFVTQVRTNTSLKTSRNSLTPFPAWDFEVSFVWLLDDDSQPNITLGTTDLKYVEGFFLDRRGRYGPFLHKDPNDYLVAGGNMLRLTDQLTGGDGVTTEFWFARTLAPFVEPVGQVDTDTGYTIYIDGVAVDPADFTFVAPNKITFDVAPDDGAVITADFEFSFVCHFLNDAADFESFAGNLWELQQVQFRADPVS